jgi:hypothetical protein
MTYVYESPDGGNTVYRRKMGKTDRVLHHVSPKKKQLQETQDRWIMWQDILQASKTNAILREAVERAQLIYELNRAND